MTVKLPLESIGLDFQPEENLLPEIVDRYICAVQSGEALPAVTVYSDGSNYWLFDGFHRMKAARTLVLGEIEAEIISGNLQDMEQH